MIGKDRRGQGLDVGDLVLVDFLNRFDDSRSQYRSIGEVITGRHFGFRESEYFVRVKKPDEDKVVYLDLESWSHHFEKIEKDFSEKIISLYF